MTEQQPMCSASSYHGGGWYLCSRNGKIERKNKWYCKQHDPEEVIRRRAASSALSQQQFDAEMERYHREAVVMTACKDLPTDWLEAGGLPRQQEAINALLEVIRRFKQGVDEHEVIWAFADELQEVLP